MINLYFIDYRYGEATGKLCAIGVWMHNPEDGDVDIFYPDQSCPEVEEAKWVINRLVETDMKVPPDFLEFHRQRADYHGMRGLVKEANTDLDYDEFGRQSLLAAIERASNATTV